MNWSPSHDSRWYDGDGQQLRLTKFRGFINWVLWTVSQSEWIYEISEKVSDKANDTFKSLCRPNLVLQLLFKNEFNQSCSKYSNDLTSFDLLALHSIDYLCILILNFLSDIARRLLLQVSIIQDALSKQPTVLAEEVGR